MVLEPGKAYRAKTAAGNEITFTVIESGDGNWSSVELDEGGVVEPNVWLNMGQLLWISSEPKRKLAISKAADEIIDVLESSIDKSYVPEAGRGLVGEDQSPSLAARFPGIASRRGYSGGPWRASGGRFGASWTALRPHSNTPAWVRPARKEWS
jgi:hypothetical protein